MAKKVTVKKQAIRAKRMSELVKNPRPVPKHGQKWGNWALDAETETLHYVKGRAEGYWIPLKDMFASSKVLDWIFQLNAKSWTSAEDIGNLVRAIDNIIDPQANLCSGGGDYRIGNMSEFLSDAIKK